MRFTFEADQLLFRDAVRDLLAKQCTPAHVRDVWDDQSRNGVGQGGVRAGVDLQGRARAGGDGQGRAQAGGDAQGRALAGGDERWAALAGMGVVGLTVPEADGGLGLDETSLVLILQETGWAALPEPLADTAAVAAPALAEAGAHEWLARVAAGDARVGVAVGGARYVVGADRADLFVVEDGGALYAVASTVARSVPQPALDLARPLFSVSWPAGAATRLDGADAAAAYDRGALAAGAELLGVAQHLIDMTAAYARDRHQFGVPIGSFQAVKHHLANALVSLELARPAVYKAAWSVAQADATRPIDVSLGKALASDAADQAARAALQVHGAIGYTWECDLHFWLKRAWSLSAGWGDAAWHRRRIGRSVLRPR